MKFHLTSLQRKLFCALLLITLLLRLLFLGSYPLADTTEARYGEIARLMAETGDWVTPQIHQGVPFWGKPPLSIWLSAISIKIFGVNEFAVRLPSFLIALAALALVYLLAARQRDRDFALVAAVILATSLLFFVSSGAVMTDPALLLGTTLSMVAFWRAVVENKHGGRIWGYLFFFGLAIGLLAKGPVALVLTAIPVGAWTLWRGQWGTAWRRMPWMLGLLLCLALSAPWYWLAEVKTPGFLDYFFIGEHWKRFVVPGWQGDLYGDAHSCIRGTIWYYWLGAAFPWSLAWIAVLCRNKMRGTVGRIILQDDGWIAYLALWAVVPMVFFSLAGNILWTYILPGLPASALLMAEFMLFQQAEVEPLSPPTSFGAGHILKVATGTASLFALGLVVMAAQLAPVNKSQKNLVAAYQNDRQNHLGQLVYLFKRPQSAEFYSRGMARFAEQTEDTEDYFKNSVRDYFAVREGDVERLPEEIISNVSNLGEFNGHYLLIEKFIENKYASVKK